MHHKLLTILFCVVGLGAAYGSQIRLMNARFVTTQTVSVTTDLFTTNNMSMTVPPRYPAAIGINNIPVSEYVELPNYLFDLYQNLTMFVYDVDDYFMPLVPKAQTSKILVDNQRYTLIYVAKSEEIVDPPTDVPDGLFVVEELAPSPGPFLKIVNVAVASYPYGSLFVRTDRFGDFDIPYGGDSGFVGVSVGFVNITVFFPGSTKSIFAVLNDLSTVLYIRGDTDGVSDFSYELAESNWYDFNTVAPVNAAPVSEPVSAPVYYAPVATPVFAPTAPIWIKVRFLNSADPYFTSYTLFINGNETIINATLMSGYQYLYGPSGQYEAAVFDSLGNLYSYTSLFLEAGKSYTIVNESPFPVQIADDLPSWFTNRTSSYARIANFAFNASVLFDLDYWGTATWEMMNGDVYNFVESFGGYGRVTAVADYQNITANFYMPPATATTVYILRQNGTMFFYVDTQTLPGSTQVCVNGYLESNGACNCFSGYTSDNSQYKCTVAAPYYCFNSQNDSLSNEFVPWIPYWNTQVYGNQLYFTVQSQIVTGRRTVIEMPNPQCNLLNNPQYYYKYDGGCYDTIYVNVPFTECGFTKTSTSSEDLYRGTVLVKQIDRVMVAGTAYDRVIETPMPISIRLPKTLAVQSYLQVYGPPSLGIEAAFVGQTVSTQSQSGNLQYVSAVQYPLVIDDVQLVDLPYGVFAWVEVVNVNCSAVGPCVQRLEIHINTTTCSISGVYRMVVSLGCRSEQGCPEGVTNGTQVYLESRIVSQSLCGEMNVDIELYGYLQAFTDESMSNAALAFYPGQSAYFLISAFSPRVSLSKLSLVALYYYGPNVNYEYLYYNSTATDLAAVNSFTTGSLGASQAYFGLDVSVSYPGSGNYSLFKLYQGQNGVYNFIAVVDVEWYVENSPLPTAPVAVPVAAPSFKKRMTLQGSVANQGSQFAAQVQIAGPTPSSQPQQQQTPITVQTPTDNDPVSQGISLTGSAFGLAVMAIFALF